MSAFAVLNVRRIRQKMDAIAHAEHAKLDEPQVRIVQERFGIEQVNRRIATNSRASHGMQLAVQSFEQPVGGVRVASIGIVNQRRNGPDVAIRNLLGDGFGAYAATTRQP